MGSAEFIGRVGALAVALGIGAAVAGAPGIAVADTSADSSPAPDSSSAQGSAAAKSTSTDGSKPAASVDTSSDGDDDDASATSGVAEPNDEKTAVSTDADNSVTPENTEPDAGEAADVEPTEDQEPNPPDEPRVSKNSPPPPAAEPFTLTHASGNVAIDSSAAADPHARVAVARATKAADQTGTTVSLTPVSSTAATVSAAATAAVLDTPMPAPQAARVGPVGVVSVVLGWLGLGPSMSTAPATPAAQPLLLGLLAWVRREFQRTFFNRTPTTSYNPAENSQTITDTGLVTAVTGGLKALDADGDALTFSVVQAPGDGSVRINPDGTFVYTPGRELAALGGTDVFVVKTADVGFHLHGPFGVFKADFGRSTTTAVEVAVDASCVGGCVFSPIKVIGTIAVGDGPDGVAFSQDGTRAYVANALDDTVSVIDTVTGTVTGTIAVGDSPRDVAVNPVTNRAYVTNLLDGTVSVINTLNNTVITTVDVGVFAERVAVSPGGTRVYVIASQTNGSTMSVINATTNTVISSATLNGHPYDVAVTPNGVRVFVTTQIDWLDVVEILGNNVTHIDTNAGWMRGIAFSPLGTRVYIANSDLGTVSVLNANTYALIDTISVGSNPHGVAISPDGTRVYVVNQDDQTLSVIRTSTNTVIATIPVGFLPNEVAISPDGTRAYVTNAGSDTVSVLQLA